LSHPTQNCDHPTAHRAAVNSPLPGLLPLLPIAAPVEGWGYNMVEETFATFIARDRERLNKEREEISNQQHELKGKLDAVNRELTAIDAYEAAKSGKQLAPAKQVRRYQRTP
jgi:hypothetical protein